MMSASLTDAKVRLMINGPEVLDPRKYTAHHLKSHNRCDLHVKSPHKKDPKVVPEEAEKDPEYRAKNQKFLVGKSSLF